ncbi:MAG: SIMPL domain-containing protein [Gemmatimonadaceae bacterium]
MPDVAAGAQAGADTTRAAIVTSAVGEAHVIPDRAAVYVGVQTRSTTAAVAARDNAQRQRAVIDAIIAAGVPREQITTENYSVSPDTRFDQSTQKTTVVGYVVSNVVRAEVRKIDQVATVLDAALAKGANQINSLDFFSSNSDSSRHEALVHAITRARADAEVMARAAGGSLGPLLELSTSAGEPRPVYRMALSVNAEARPTPIEPGQQLVSVSVSARWRFVAVR